MAKLKPILTLISVLIISLAVGYALAAWQEATQIPPEGNVPVPINIGPEAQVKEGSPGTIAAGGFLGQLPGYGIYPDPGGASTIGGSLTITGSTSYLRLSLLTTAQRDALNPPAGPQTGMMIYNTTQGTFQIYVPSEWKNLTGGMLLGQACTDDLGCSSGHCVDSYCCDTTCTGAVCQTCGPYSSNGVGYCGWVNASTQDPRSVCDTSGCQTGNCNGSSYACGYYADNAQHNCNICNACDASGNCTARTVNYSAATALGCTAGSENCRNCSAGTCGYYASGTQNCGACKDCNASGVCANVANNTDPYAQCGGASCCGYCSGGACANIANGSTCSAPGTACTAIHYRCDGGGSCTAPTYDVCHAGQSGVAGNSFCASIGALSCVYACYTSDPPCSCGAPQSCTNAAYWEEIKCRWYTYD